MTNTFDTKLATNLGLVEAIVYDKLQAMYEVAEINKDNFRDNIYLAKLDRHYLSQALPFFSGKEIEVAIDNLNVNGLIKVMYSTFFAIVPLNEITLVQKTKRTLAKPRLEDVQEYAKENGRPELATKFFNYYEGMEWHDMSGKTVKNWKAKFLYWCERDAKAVQPNREVL